MGHLLEILLPSAAFYRGWGLINGTNSTVLVLIGPCHSLSLEKPPSPSLLAAGDKLLRRMYAPQLQKFHTGDIKSVQNLARGALIGGHSSNIF